MKLVTSYIFLFLKEKCLILSLKIYIFLINFVTRHKVTLYLKRNFPNLNVKKNIRTIAAYFRTRF